jgi:hypothetical protein
MTTITPTGLPAWTRTADHTVYGGHLQKQNYQSQGVINPRTDVGAEAIARLAADAEATTRTCPFAVLTYLNRDATPLAPTIESAYLMTGIRASSYAGDAAPTGFPSAVRNSTGKVTFTFAASYSDPYGISAAFTPSHVVLGMNGTTFVDATWVISGSTVAVSCFDAAGAALGDRRITLVVW